MKTKISGKWKKWQMKNKISDKWKKRQGTMCKDNSQLVSASPSLTWKNIFSLMLKVLKLILQLRYLLDQTRRRNVCWCHCLRTYRKWKG